MDTAIELQDIRIKNLPAEKKKQLMNIARKEGISLTALLKGQINILIKSYPEHVTNPKESQRIQ